MIVIIGLMTGLVALNLNSDDDPEEIAARELARAAALASRSALLEGVPQSLSVSTEGWTMRGFTEDGWQTVAQGDYAERVRVSAFADNIPLELTEEPLPLALWEPTGQADAWEVVLDGRNTDWTVRGDAGGEVVVVADR